MLKMMGHCFYCLKLTGRSHLFDKIDGWHVTLYATPSYGGPAKNVYVQLRAKQRAHLLDKHYENEVALR